MKLCADKAHSPSQAMYHTALAFTTMHPEKHFRIPDYLPAPFGTKSSASNIYVTKSQKLLRKIQYYFYEKKASQDMPNPFDHITHFMGSPAALILESPLNAGIHDISEVPLLGTFSSFKIDTQDSNCQTSSIALVSRAELLQEPNSHHSTLHCHCADTSHFTIFPFHVQSHSLYCQFSISRKPT
jgi:hypothetical protein